MSKFQAQLDHCCGPAPKPLLKPKPKTGLQKEAELQRLEDISTEYHKWFEREK